MGKIKEVMRLRFELKVGYQQIGRSCSMSESMAVPRGKTHQRRRRPGLRKTDQ